MDKCSHTLGFLEPRACQIHRRPRRAPFCKAAVESTTNEQTMLAAWAKMHCGTIMLVAISFALGSVLSSRTNEWIWWNTCSPKLFSRSRHSPVPHHLQIRRSSASSHPSPSSLDQKSAYLMLQQTSFSGITARPFELWTHPLPCFPPEEDWMTQAVQDSPTATGFLYVVSF